MNKIIILICTVLLLGSCTVKQDFKNLTDSEQTAISALIQVDTVQTAKVIMHDDITVFVAEDDTIIQVYTVNIGMGFAAVMAIALVLIIILAIATH